MIQSFSFKSSTGVPLSGNIAPLLLGCRDFVNPTTLGYDINGSPNLVTGALRGLTLTVNTAPGSGKSWTFTVQINGVDTAMTVTIADTNTSARTSSGDVAIADGDYITLKGTSSGSPSNFTSLWTQFDVESEFPGESQYHRNFGASGGGYCGVFNHGLRRNSVDPAVDIVPTAGAITKLRVRGQTNGGGQNHVFTVYVDSGSGFVAQDGTGGTPDTRVSISVAGSYDTSSTFDLPVSVGDLVYVQCVTTNGTVGGCLSTRFVADLDGESICANNTNANLATGTQYYFARNHSDFAPAASDAVLGNGNLIVGAAAFSAGKLHVRLSAAPGAGKSYAFTLRKNSVSQALTCTVTGAATQTASDTTNSFNLEDGDLFSMQVVSAGSPASAIGTWSFVQYIPVPPLVCTQIFTQLLVRESAEDETPSDGCTGGGTVASGTTPDDGVSLDTAQAPIVYAHIYLGGSPDTVLRIAGQWVPHGDPKAPYVLEWGDVERALCDSDGGPQAATQEILLFDRNGDIRAARQADTLRHAAVDVFIADLSTIQSNGTPWRVNRGFISKCRPEGDRTFRLTITDVLTTRLNNIDGEDQQMPSLLLDGTFAGLESTAQAFGTPGCDLYGSLSGDGGCWQCAYVGTALYPGRVDLGPLSWFMVGPGVITIRTVWLASLSAAKPNQRVLVPESAFGTYIFRPEDLTGQKWFTFAGRRWTLIAGVSGSPAIKLAREGRIPLLVEACGYETVGDGTGNTIDSPPRALLHWMNNRLLQDATDDWLDIAEEGGIDLFDTASFEAVHSALIANADGFEPHIAGAIGFEGQKNWRDIIADVCRNFGFEIGTNRHGQVMATTLDRVETSPPASPRLFDESQILESSVEPDDGALQVENRIRYVFKRRYDDPLPSLTPEQESRLPNDPFKADWISGEQSVTDGPSVVALGGGLRGLRRSQVQEYGLVRDSNTAVMAAQTRRDLLSPPNGRLEGTVALSLRHGWDLELGDVIALQHWDLNWTGSRRCQVRRLRLNLDALTITVGWRDVDDLLTGFTGYEGSTAGAGETSGDFGGDPIDGLHDDGGTDGTPGGGVGGDGDSVPPVDGGTPSDSGMYRPQLPVSAAGRTPGGRGGTVYRINTLADNADPPTAVGDGTYRCSLRRALQYELGARMIVFEVSGYINNSDAPIQITAPYVTVAGQTAPSPGITLQNEGVQILTHDVVFQHFAIRPGNWAPDVPQILETERRDGVVSYSAYAPSYNIVWDHMSVSWACDKNMDVYNIPYGDVVVWRCLNAEALYRTSVAILLEGQPSSLGLLFVDCNLAADSFLVAQSVFAHNSDRNPEVHEGARLNFVNNIVYDWGRDETPYPWASFTYSANLTTNPLFVNYINNRYIGGISAHPSLPLYAIGHWSGYPGSAIYISGNVVDETVQAVSPWFLNPNAVDPRTVSLAIPLMPGYTPLSASSMQATILAHAGARPLDRDDVDARIIDDIENYTGTVISHQDDVGGYPTLANNTAAFSLPANHNDPSPTRGAPFTVLEDYLETLALALEP